MKPVSVTKDIDYNTLESLIEFIHNTPYLSKLVSFDMLPEELARPCSWRCLLDKHMSQSEYFQNLKMKIQFKIYNANS